MKHLFSDRKEKKILLLVGHPDSTPTLSSELADVYEAGAKHSGHEVRRFDLGTMRFDPILHRGYKVIQELEPDLKAFHEAIKWCDHFVVLYPNWWCTMPALLKGLFDRAWLPGTCFNFYKDDLRGNLGMWKRMQKGKTARVIVLSGTHPFIIWLLFGDYTNEIKRGILWFSGFKVSLSRFGPTDHPTSWKVDGWRKDVLRLGRLGE